MNKKRGFTIVELMVIIVVIAILASITVVGYGYMRRDAVQAKMRANVSQVQNYLQSHRALNGGKYPESRPVGGGVSSTTIDASDLSSFLSDPDMPFTPYVLSPDRTKFCILVTSKTYSDMRMTIRDDTGSGTVTTVETETTQCPASYPNTPGA